MASELTGYEKPLNQYSKNELVALAEKYTISYTARSGKTKMSGYAALPKEQLISLIQNDKDYLKAALKPLPTKETASNQYPGLTGYEQPLENYNISQLKSIASRLGIAGYSRFVKEKIIDLIRNNKTFQRNTPDRVTLLQNRLTRIGNDSDAIMRIIQEVFSDTSPFPIKGQAYTFIYNAKTPGIVYDQHPLIIVDSIISDQKFRGFNVHWNDYRNYTLPEVGSQFHIVNKGPEFDYLCDVPYKKLLKN